VWSFRTIGEGLTFCVKFRLLLSGRRVVRFVNFLTGLIGHVGTFSTNFLLSRDSLCGTGASQVRTTGVGAQQWARHNVLKV